MLRADLDTCLSWSADFAPRVLWLLLGAALLTALPAGAQPAPADKAAAEGVPAPLAQWLPWVRAQDEKAACPVRDGRALCFWPGPMSLSHSGRRTGVFAFDVLVRLPAARAAAGCDGALAAGCARRR